MSFKKRIVMSMVSGILGVSLVGGGTFAYFSDTEVTTNTFAAGTLDLAVNPTQIINVDNIKPGDFFVRDFELQNNGTLDIAEVLLETEYRVIDAKGNNTEDFGKHILVKFLYNLDKFNEVVYEATLADLKTMSPDAVSEAVFGPILEGSGLEAGSRDDLVVEIHFVDNGEEQNEFQGDSLELTWKFTATQTEGEEK